MVELVNVQLPVKNVSSSISKTPSTNSQLELMKSTHASPAGSAGGQSSGGKGEASPPSIDGVCVGDQDGLADNPSEGPEVNEEDGWLVMTAASVNVAVGLGEGLELGDRLSQTVGETLGPAVVGADVETLGLPDGESVVVAGVETLGLPDGESV